MLYYFNKTVFICTLSSGLDHNDGIICFDTNYAYWVSCTIEGMHIDLLSSATIRH